MNELHTRNITVNEPHSGNSSVNELHTHNVTVSEPHSSNSSVSVASYPGRSKNKKKTAWYPLFAHVRPSPEKPGDPV